MIIRELIEFRPEHRTTSLSEPLRYLTNLIKKRCTTFILSDFLDTKEGESAFEEALKIASGKHDLVGIRIYDRRETELPDVGIVELQDAETGRKAWVDTSSRTVRDTYRRRWEESSRAIDTTLRRSRVDSVSVATGEDYVKSLIKLFKKR